MSATIGAATPRVFGFQDYSLLEFERLRWGSVGRKETEVLARFDLTMVGYYARLRWILEQPEAAAYDIHLVKRLSRVAADRRAVRTLGTAAAGFDTVADPRGVRPMMFGAVTR